MSVESLKMERDAAIRARDDLAAQLRVMKKRLQDAEEEQYKAEEDNASLRAELEFLHHKEEDRKLIASSAATDRYDLLEQEVAILKIELQNALRRVQEEQQAVANEQQRSAKLVAEHEQLKLELAEAKSIHEGHQDSITRALNEDLLKEKDYQLRELASMVERLESGRQKLLVEVQSFLQENGSLRAELKDLRSSLASNTEKSFGELLDTERNTERSKLQMELNSVKEEADTLRAQVLQLTASLNLETQHRSSLNWLYKPVLANIENRLQQLKHVGNQNQLPQLFVI